MLAESTIRSVIPAKIGQAWLMLDARCVQEIIGARPWVPVPRSSALVPGALAWRGRAVAVFDLSVLAAAGERLERGCQRHRTLIAESDGCLLAMPVDAIREVQEIDASHVQDARVTSLEHCPTEVEIFGTLAPVIDLSSLVASVLVAVAAGHDL